MSSSIDYSILTPIGRTRLAGGRLGGLPEQMCVRWKGSNPGDREYYGDGTGGVVVSSLRGDGNMIWWADSFPLTNYGITQASDLNLLLNSLGRAGTVRILWDEYYHGERAGLWSDRPRRPSLGRCYKQLFWRWRSY